MIEPLINHLSGFVQLRALFHDLRHTDDSPVRRQTFLRQLTALTYSRPAALVTACRAARLHERSRWLAFELCRHALDRVESEAERSAVLAYGSSIGWEGPGDAPRHRAPPAAYLTLAQRQALVRLRAMVELFLDGPPAGRLAPRLIPLIIGPSGVGKNHLVRALGRVLNCPVLRLTMGDWIVQGSRRQSTFERLRDFLTPLPRAILHLDELDKFRLSNDPWLLCLFGEVFSVLDREVGITTDEKPWTVLHAEKLRRAVFIVGSGTWQDAWQCARPLGFREKPEAVDAGAAIRRSGLVPPELVNRFNDHWLVLEPYRADDFRALVAELGLPPGLIDPAAAAASGLNFRYVENAYTEHLLAPGLARACPDVSP